MRAKKSTKKTDSNDLSNLRQEAERKKNMKIAKQTMGPASSMSNKQLAKGNSHLSIRNKPERDEQKSDGSANAFKDK
jgi:hypothetical protein